MGESWASSPCPSWAPWATASVTRAGMGDRALPTALKNSLTPSEPRAKASGMLAAQRENALFPPKGRSALFSPPFCKGSTSPGENTVQGKVSTEQQCQRQIMCHQTLVPTPGTHCPTSGVPCPGLTGDSSAHSQFLAENSKSKPRAPRGALNPSHSASMHIQQLVPASVSPPGQ